MNTPPDYSPPPALAALAHPSGEPARAWGRPRFTGENLQQNLLLAERVRELAAEKATTPGQLALAWVLHRGEHIVPIPGTKRVAYLEENLAAAAVSLSEDEVEHIAVSVPPASGDRYDPAGMRALNL